VADVTSLPAIDGQRICAVAFQGRVSCFDPSSGAVLWARDMSSVAGMALDARYLYVTDEKDAIVALDKTNGASIWKQDKMGGRRVSGPLAFGRYVVVGDYQGYVHFISREDGSFAARIATDGSSISAPPIALDLTSFLVQTRNGGVYAITISEHERGSVERCALPVSPNYRLLFTVYRSLASRHRHRRPAQRRQVDAIQPPDAHPGRDRRRRAGIDP
jgi:outer membrane protein assembly factor BamB